jgi:uncharacterized protein YqfA (UPF0365 family)
MDYFRMNNIKADTEMRGAIGAGVAREDEPPVPPPGDPRR